MQLRILGLSTAHHDAAIRKAPDANGQPPLVRRAEGHANPCRHCLGLIADGEDKLVLSYRPFSGLYPYAESGPIFLHTHACRQHDAAEFPPWFAYLDPAIVRGYGADDWIRYDTGQVVAGANIRKTCERILEDESVAYVHIRSKFNCFQCRVERALG